MHGVRCRRADLVTVAGAGSPDVSRGGGRSRRSWRRRKAASSCRSKTRVRALRSAGGSLSSWKSIRPPATANERQLPLALLKDDFTYWPLTTGVVLSRRRARGTGWACGPLGHSSSMTSRIRSWDSRAGEPEPEPRRRCTCTAARGGDPRRCAAPCRSHVHHGAVEVIRELEDH